MDSSNALGEKKRTIAVYTTSSGRPRLKKKDEAEDVSIPNKPFYPLVIFHSKLVTEPIIFPGTYCKNASTWYAIMPESFHSHVRLPEVFSCPDKLS